MIKILNNFSQIATLQGVHEKDGRKLVASDLGIIEKASVIHDGNSILWVGPSKKLPKKYKANKVIDFSGHVLIPEIIDSHTHLIFGGNRAEEYAQRLNGATYEDIAKMGGGITYTMKQTRKLSLKEYIKLGKKRIDVIHSYGIHTIEIKSGYGLNYKKEKELAQAIHSLKKHYAKKNIRIFNTFMAAHSLPPEFSTTSDYMKEVVLPLLEELANEKLIDAVDIFFEKNYFTHEDTENLFNLAKKLGIPTKMHADEFNDNKGAVLGAKFGSLSCDHLLATQEDGIKALAQSQTVATLLPGTGLFLGKPIAKARSMLDNGVKVAMASDYNPGSCHCDNVILLASIAAPLYKMNQAELFSSITHNAAHALGLKNQGAIIPGLMPRFSIFKCNTVSEITYNWGKNLATKIIS